MNAGFPAFSGGSHRGRKSPGSASELLPSPVYQGSANFDQRLGYNKSGVHGNEVNYGSNPRKRHASNPTMGHHHASREDFHNANQYSPASTSSVFTDGGGNISENRNFTENRSLSETGSVSGPQPSPGGNPDTAEHSILGNLLKGFGGRSPGQSSPRGHDPGGGVTRSPATSLISEATGSPAVSPNPHNPATWGVKGRCGHY